MIVRIHDYSAEYAVDFRKNILHEGVVTSAKTTISIDDKIKWRTIWGDEMVGTITNIHIMRNGDKDDIVESRDSILEGDNINKFLLDAIDDSGEQVWLYGGLIYEVIKG